MKTMPDALAEQYPDFPFHEYGVVGWDGDYVYCPEAWPDDWPDAAPTLAQVQAWMAA